MAPRKKKVVASEETAAKNVAVGEASSAPSVAPVAPVPAAVTPPATESAVPIAPSSAAATPPQSGIPEESGSSGDAGKPIPAGSSGESGQSSESSPASSPGGTGANPAIPRPQGQNGFQQQGQQRGFWKNRKNRFNRPGQPGFKPQPQPPPQPPVPRNPDLPEYKLADIHSWDNAEIVAKMWPDANAEDLGAMKRHEIIFNAIRSYLSRGGAVMASGCLEVVKEGFGYLRSAKTNFLSCPEDVFVPQQQIRRHALRPGDTVEGPIRDPRDRDKLFGLGGVVTVNGKTPSEAARIVHFENLTPTFPTRRIVLETTPGELSTRIVDIFTPVGFGQRGLIVAPPRVGKTVLLQKIANAITANHPDAILIVLLIDERPEEVTDMQRNTKAIVLSSTFDEDPHHHVNVAEMTGEMARRQVENGRDVIILLDSITRLARAYNTVQPHSGKILTGGVDALALHRPKRFFGAARNIEGGGSLTIIATGLVDTGSRMDEVDRKSVV